MCERPKVKVEVNRHTHTRWRGGMGYLRRGKCIREERFGSGKGECVCQAALVTWMLRLIRYNVILVESISDMDVKVDTL